MTTVNVLPSQRPEKGSRSAGRLVEVKVYGVVDDDGDLVAVPGQPQPVQARGQICTERDGEAPSAAAVGLTQSHQLAGRKALQQIVLSTRVVPGARRWFWPR